MQFDPKKWRCTTCNRIGTLCTTIANTTIYRQVTSISHNYITTGAQFYVYGQFNGYRCFQCGTQIADTPEKLKVMFDQK